MKIRAMASFSAALSMSFAASGFAAEHFIEIAQVHSSEDETVQFVKLQMEAPFQNAVGIGNQITLQDAEGNFLSTFGVFEDDVANHGPGVPILIGTPEVEAAFGVKPDLVVDPLTAAEKEALGCNDLENHPELVGDPRCETFPIPFSGGRVCWVTPAASECGPLGECDCVAYGDYAGDNGPFGEPTIGLAPDRALQKISFGTNVTWAANGTEVPGLMDNCRDWIRTAPLPVNNALEYGALPDPAALVPDQAHCLAGAP